MEAAWKESNYTVAEFMSRKITDEQQLSQLPVQDVRAPKYDCVEALLTTSSHLQRLSLAGKLYSIGKSVLKNQTPAPRNNACESIAWLQKAFSILDQLDDATIPTVSQEKIPVLRTLAKAYFLSESYDRAETTLQELVPSIDESNEHACPEYQELRWLRLAILKRRKAADSAILDAFTSIIDHMMFSESSVTDILQDLRTLAQRHTLVTAVNQSLLQRAFGSGSEFVNRILLSLIIHSAKDENQSRAVGTIGAAFTSVLDAEFQLECVPATACISLLWQYGDRHYNTKRWPEAAEWFLAGTHRLLKEVCPASVTKCYRKAALCYIEQKEYAKATAVIRSCPDNEAATHYVTFLTVIHQGLEDEGRESQPSIPSVCLSTPFLAIKALHNVVAAPDFDRKILLLATQMSHESEMKSVLLVALEALLKTLKASQSGETVLEAMTLLRCVIRLSLKLLVEPTANKTQLIDNVVKHFHTAKVLVDSACEQKATALIIKDISWLWRTAYNSAVQGCSEWEGYQDQICSLFEVSRDLLESCCHGSPVEPDTDIYVHLIYASFSGVSGRIFAVREQMSTEGVTDTARLREITAEIKRCRTRISEILETDRITDESDALRAQYILFSLRVFEVEMLVTLKEWDDVLQVIGSATKSGPLAVGTFEAIADLLWVSNECPINVLYGGLEAILHASLDHNALSVEKFSRWLRAICTIILARNSSADRLKAIGYVEQAATVMEEHHEGDEAYPMDERLWLLGTSYNTGLECLELVVLPAD
ncbi:sporulation-specific protein 22 [Paramarasmius palmivorus]|uniref:Sporulation-specific protein 22 n=1 Tax=Paramarasmius palmivorus TaxID=297713 RepID=A0AAW0D895_9AGAR